MIESKLHIARSLFSRLQGMVYLIGIAILLYFCNRLLFLYLNKTDFADYSSFELFKAIVSGIKYDLHLALIVNSIFIILYLSPVRFYNSFIYQSFLKIYYVAVNATALLFGIFDANYFRLNKMRLVYDNFYHEIHHFFEHLQSITFHEFINYQVILILAWIFMLVFLSYALWYVKQIHYEHKLVSKVYKFISIAVVFTYISFSWILYTNGQKFIENLHFKTDRRLIPLQVNNPYLVLRSAGSNYIEQKESWDFEQYNSIRKYPMLDSTHINMIRLFIIELEKDNVTGLDWDFGKNSKEKASLKILNSENTSIFSSLDEILIGIPGILNCDFYQSIYSLNHVESLVQILQKMEFNTSFISFHIDDKTSSLIKNFYGFNQKLELTDEILNSSYQTSKNQINDNKKFEFYLLKIADDISQIEHERLKNYLESISDSLDFVNSLNIVYTLKSKGENQKSEILKNLTISTPKIEKYIKNDSTIYQALDLMPSILHFINYPKAFVSYGSSIFSDESRTLITSSNGNSFNILKDSLLLNFYNNKTISLRKLNHSRFFDFDYKDSLIVEKTQLENLIHSRTSDFYERLVDNSLFFDKE